MCDHASQVTAIILAGGKGRRMGGKDKGLLTLDGHSLIQHAIARLKTQTDRIIISANDNIDAYKQFGYPVINDKDHEFQGPLAGILSCLEMVDTPYAMVIPCDSPYLPLDLVERMHAQLQTSNKDIAIVFDGQREQALFMLLSVKLRTDLKEAFDQGQRRVNAWVQGKHPDIVDFSDQTEAFLNINTPEQLTNNETQRHAE